MFRKPYKLFIALGSILVVVLGFMVLKPGSQNSDAIEAVIYKSATCGCCLGHAGYLKGENFDVKVEIAEDIASVKEKYNIPYDKQSCHTTLIGDYFVEGHVPIEAIDKLLAEMPDIDGITLPDMPAGSPGMPGVKNEEFVIYALKDGQASEFMRI